MRINFRSLWLLFLSCALLILVSFESFKYEIGEEKAAYYFMLVSILIGAMLGIIFTRDLFNLYVFVEITTIAACGIISIKMKRKRWKLLLNILY